MRRILVVVGFLVGGVPAHAQKPPDPFDVIDPSVLKVDVPALVRVRTADDVARVRKELVSFIWKNDGRLPTTAEVKRADAALPKPLEKYPATCQTLTVPLGKGLKSVVYHLRPKVGAKKLAVFHQGHGDLWTGGAAETVTFLLDKGFAVLACQMPLFGDNKRFAPAGVASHDDLGKLASKDLEPIRYFVEPVLVSLNDTIQRTAPEDVLVIGLSGGGWTTTLYAALDPRVRLSVPVAGTLPDYLRTVTPARDRGDWEQYYPDLYKIANYLDLYVLGASGRDRRQLQVLNKYDSCCFAGVGYRTYEAHVAKAVTGIGPGEFQVFLDDTHRGHLISRHALEKSIGPLIDAPRTK